jgi:sugar/nucleoside kinase (ribokinase family)
MAFDYVAIGVVTEDLWPGGGVTPGGTVMFASRSARMQCESVGVITLASADFDIAGVFPDIDVARIDVPHTTQYWNVYNGGNRTQFTRFAGVRLGAADIGERYRNTRIAHLAPLNNEVDPGMLRVFAANVFVGLTPQGWLRRWDAEGRVTQKPANWTDARPFLVRADAVVMSIEDVGGDWTAAESWASQTRVLVVTEGDQGCTIFAHGERTCVPAPQIKQVEPTGAGDVFASTFFIALQRGDALLDAARYANCVAATKVSRPRLEGLPRPEDLARCRQRT